MIGLIMPPQPKSLDPQKGIFLATDAAAYI